MPSAEFTPGPWTAEPGTPRGAWIKGASGEWAALALGDSDERAAANAHLIAAAPELYEALEIVRDADEDCKRDGFPTIPSLVRKQIDAALALALARVRGEPS